MCNVFEDHTWRNLRLLGPFQSLVPEWWAVKTKTAIDSPARQLGRNIGRCCTLYVEWSKSRPIRASTWTRWSQQQYGVLPLHAPSASPCKKSRAHQSISTSLQFNQSLYRPQSVHLHLHPPLDVWGSIDTDFFLPRSRKVRHKCAIDRLQSSALMSWMLSRNENEGNRSSRP